MLLVIQFDVFNGHWTEVTYLFAPKDFVYDKKTDDMMKNPPLWQKYWFWTKFNKIAGCKQQNSQYF